MNTNDLTEQQPIDPMTDTGKMYLLMRRAYRDELAEQKKRFNIVKLIRNVISYILSELNRYE